MTHAELVILLFLKASPETFFSRKEISMRAIKRRQYEEDPQWAVIPLASLVAKGLVEVNDSGYYRFKKGSTVF